MNQIKRANRACRKMLKAMDMAIDAYEDAIAELDAMEPDTPDACKPTLGELTAFDEDSLVTLTGIVADRHPLCKALTECLDGNGIPMPSPEDGGGK